MDFSHPPIFIERGIKGEDSPIEKDLKSRETVSTIRLSMCMILKINIMIVDGSLDAKGGLTLVAPGHIFWQVDPIQP